MTNEDVIWASPLPGDMEGNEPPVGPEADDQLPFADPSSEVIDDDDAN